jgi:glycosyltransferase involved in cell wall biosynthesis
MAVPRVLSGLAMKRLLMVAYHFPPLAGSSGIQRTLRFVQHLPEFGWETTVLTVHPRAYERTSDDLLRDVPPGTRVERAFAIDAARHLSLAGRYPGFLARPDRWISWRFAGIATGLRIIRDWQPQAIWSTFPIATAHVIGDALQRRSGLPWIADFRDPMAQEGYPVDPRVWRSYQRIEERAIRRARYGIFTTPSAARMYRNRYPDAAERIVVLENGYDEESFSGIGDATRTLAPLNAGARTLLHAGLVYPSERDPTQLFAALRRLVDSGRLRHGTLKVRFRASGHEPFLRGLIRTHRLDDWVELLPPVPYRAALDEMVRADGLLLLQAANCNEQIPAKIYEYIRAGRPILALTDPQGDTAAVVRDAGLNTIARLDSEDEIADLLVRFVDAERTGPLPLPHADYVARASRRGRAQSLAKLLDEAAASR